jgi:hypothetical protein
MRLLPALILLLPCAAHALSVDPKAMARFDIGYTHCEQQMPQMRGHRDDAWLSLWRVKADAQVRARLAAVRKGPAYQAERARALKAGAASAAAAASAASPIDQQCQALWAETQRILQSKP